MRKLKTAAAVPAPFGDTRLKTGHGIVWKAAKKKRGTENGMEYRFKNFRLIVIPQTGEGKPPTSAQGEEKRRGFYATPGQGTR